MTCPGSIIVTIIKTNQNWRPLKRMRARPNATTAEEKTMPIEARTATNSEFLKNVPNV